MVRNIFPLNDYRDGQSAVFSGMLSWAGMIMVQDLAFQSTAQQNKTNKTTNKQNIIFKEA